jgi:hypothetical protein
MFEPVHEQPNGKLVLNNKTSVATVILDCDDFWVYHKPMVEDIEDEKINPADKAWLIVKYIQVDSKFATKKQQHLNEDLNRGYKLRIGDIIKFGRVRFKVIQY